MVAEFVHKQIRRIGEYFSRYNGRLTIRTPNIDPIVLNEQAAKENALTRPPDDEDIKLSGVWGVEIYTSMQFDELEDGLREIGWADDQEKEDNNNPVVWLRESRHSFGVESAGFNESRLNKPHRFWIKETRSVRLPKNMARGNLSMLSLTPSMVAVVAWFELTEDGSRCYDEVLRTDRRFVFKRQRGRRRPYGPKSQKYDYIDQTRSEIVASIWNWFREYMPGMFASGLLRNELPTCEFVTIQKGEPLADQVDKRASNHEYLEVLGLQNNSGGWQYASLPGLKITLPGYRLFAPKFHSLAAINWSKMTEDTDRDRSDKHRRWMRRIDEMIANVLCTWSVLAMFQGYTRRLLKVKENVIQGISTSTNVTDVLAGLEYEVAYSSDIATIAAELLNEDRLMLTSLRRCGSFKRVSQFSENEKQTLREYMRPLLKNRSEEALRNDQAMRDHMTQYGTLLGARENIRLQRILSRLSYFVLVVALISLVSLISVISSLEVLNFWDWVRSLDFLGGISWLDWFMDASADE